MWAGGLLFQLILAAVSGSGAFPGKGGTGDRDDGQSSPVEAIEMILCPNGDCPPFPNTPPIVVTVDVPLSIAFEIPSGFPLGTARAVVVRVDENGTPLEELGSAFVDLAPGVNRFNVSGVGEILGIILLSLQSEEKGLDALDYYARLTASSTNIGNGGSGDLTSFDSATQIEVTQNLTASDNGGCRFMVVSSKTSARAHHWMFFVCSLLFLLPLGLLRPKRK